MGAKPVLSIVREHEGYTENVGANLALRLLSEREREQVIFDRRCIRVLVLLEVLWLAAIFGAIAYGLFRLSS